MTLWADAAVFCYPYERKGPTPACTAGTDIGPGRRAATVRPDRPRRRRDRVARGNGQTEAIFRDRGGNVLATLALEILDEQIQAIR